MLKKILVCLDGSKFAEGLLPYAIDRARRFSSKIVLLKVIDLKVSVLAVSVSGMPGQSAFIIGQGQLDNMIRKEESRDRLYLETVAVKLKQMGLDVDYVTWHRMAGTIGDAIVAYARENEVDLVMMATHRNSFWKRLVFGSITESVIRKSASPVLVVSPQCGRTNEGALGEMSQASLR